MYFLLIRVPSYRRRIYIGRCSTIEILHSDRHENSHIINIIHNNPLFFIMKKKKAE